VCVFRSQLAGNFCRPVAVGHAHVHFFKALVVYAVAVRDYMLSTFDAFVDGWSVFCLWAEAL